MYRYAEKLIENQIVSNTIKDTIAYNLNPGPDKTVCRLGLSLLW
jgi:hypothetical protein